jgi:hypothetical protein
MMRGLECTAALLLVALALAVVLVVALVAVHVV